MRHVYKTYNKHTVFLGTSLEAIKGKQYTGERKRLEKV